MTIQQLEPAISSSIATVSDCGFEARLRLFYFSDPRDAKKQGAILMEYRILAWATRGYFNLMEEIRVLVMRGYFNLMEENRVWEIVVQLQFE
jgi:hypothetical protein